MHTAQLERLATVRNYALVASIALWIISAAIAGRVSRDLLIVAVGLTVSVTAAFVSSAIAHLHAQFITATTRTSQAERDRIYVDVVHGLVAGGSVRFSNGHVPDLASRRTSSN